VPYNVEKLRNIAVVIFLIACLPTWLSAEALGSDLARFLAKVPPTEFFPHADRYGEITATAPIAPVLQDDKVIGFNFLNTDFVSAIGYSGKPIKMVIGLDTVGKIVGAKLVDHAEPIVLAGIPEQKIIDFIAAYKSLDVNQADAEGSGDLPAIDIVSGATVTIMVIDDSIKRATRRAVHALGLSGLSQDPKIAHAKKTVITGKAESLDWSTLIGQGAVRRMHLTVDQINSAFARLGNEEAIARPEQGEPGETYIDLYAASLDVPTIAKSLLGEQEYKNHKARLKPGQNAFLILGTGRYSFRGSGYVRGGIFDRIQIIQGEESLRFRDKGYKNLGAIAAEGAPKFKEVALFYAPVGATFNPAEPWRLQLLAQRAVGALKKVFTTFELPYRLPDRYVEVEPPLRPASKDVGSGLAYQKDTSSELWKRMWERKRGDVIILVIVIGVLTIVFFGQNELARHRIFGDWFRTGFLLFTLFWIGFYAQAQLSVVNVFAFANALLTDFRWEYFLMEPLIFILWCSVAASLLFWGRGVYCGWLCPFGALQELTNKAARALHVPQYEVPSWLNERLWALKYIVFLALLGLSIYSLTLAEQLAEVEPFKTAIVLYFVRSWPYLVFVFALLIAGLFIERFYCRYLCLLGAALAIPGRLRMFDWLKRYPNCGDPCQICAQKCMVQAIDQRGDINANECIYCLECEQLYHDKHVCPVLIHKMSKGGGSANETSLYKRPRRLGRPRSFED
jgi:NosR/NirI family nitrous oxide reductase transcriptional regulator